MRIYNTMSERKEYFQPFTKGRVKMFVCGPTVQGPIHLGHARTYIFYDVVARYLSHLGYRVDYLMNITDVDERITTAANSAGTDPESLASHFTRQFFQDLLALGVTTVTRFEPVSRRVPDAIRNVSRLIQRGFAYTVGGWVYFDTSRFPNFGSLSHQSKDELALHPLELSSRKRNLADFSLWRPENLVPGKWRSPWGKGSPGWHIQDTAITLALFGKQYDIHGGAYELIYPHHEAEIAQGESITGVNPIVKYWVHTHLVTMEGEKMSKSVGNVYTVRDALMKYTPDELRFYFLLRHYREDMDLSGLRASCRRLNRIRKFLTSTHRGSQEPNQTSADLLKHFYKSMDDDIDTPVAIGALEDLVAEADHGGIGRKQAAEAIRTSLELLGVQTLGS